MAALLPIKDQRELEQALIRAGIDATQERVAEEATLATIRARGRISTEAEYRIVQAYVDRIAKGDRHEELLALGALLDEFMSRGAT